MRRDATLATFLVVAAAFECVAVPRLLHLNLPSLSGLVFVTFGSCAIVIGLVGGWLRVPVGWLLAALVFATYFGAVGAWAGVALPPENIWLLGLWWQPIFAPPALFGVIAWIVVKMAANRLR